MTNEQWMKAQLGENWVEDLLASTGRRTTVCETRPIDDAPPMDEWDRMLTVGPTLTAFGILLDSTTGELSLQAIVGFLSSRTTDELQALQDVGNVIASADVVLARFGDVTRTTYAAHLSTLAESMLAISLCHAETRGYGFRMNELGDPEMRMPGESWPTDDSDEPL